MGLLLPTFNCFFFLVLPFDWFWMNFVRHTFNVYCIWFDLVFIIVASILIWLLSDCGSYFFLVTFAYHFYLKSLHLWNVYLPWMALKAANKTSFLPFVGINGSFTTVWVAIAPWNCWDGFHFFVFLPSLTPLSTQSTLLNQFEIVLALALAFRLWLLSSGPLALALALTLSP